jgi:hypothetical protein
MMGRTTGTIKERLGEILENAVNATTRTAHIAVTAIVPMGSVL